MFDPSPIAAEVRPAESLARKEMFRRRMEAVANAIDAAIAWCDDEDTESLLCMMWCDANSMLSIVNGPHA